jgi:hypothetical protein
MKKITTLALGALGLVSLASACNVEVGETPEQTGNTQESACDNSQATNAVMATMAVGAANNMRRWLPQRDMMIVIPDATKPWDRRIALSQYAYPRCTSDNRQCKVMNQLLSLQADDAAGMQFGGAALDPGSLRSRLIAAWDAQMTCINRPDNHTGDDCPVEYHDLTFSYKQPNSTCFGGFDYWYHASKQNSNPPQMLSYPAQLKNMLIWAGYPNNPYLAFDTQGDDVKIDPVEGGTGSSGSGSGSCMVAANPVTVNGVLKCDSNNDPTIVSGACCTCGGQNRTWQPAPKAGFFACK